MNCSYCGKEIEEYRLDVIEACYCEEHLKRGSMPTHLTVEQNLEVLRDLREYIKSILDKEPEPEGNDLISAMYSRCMLGMCNETREVWNKPEYHCCPYLFEEHLRVAPLTRVIKCHFDTREGCEPPGCFHTCMVFQARSFEEIPSVRKTLELIDQLLVRYE